MEALLTDEQIAHILSRPRSDGHSQVMAMLAREVQEHRARAAVREPRDRADAIAIWATEQRV